MMTHGHFLSISQSMQALEPIGRKITENLYGLPLAIKVIGASLRNKLEESHWEKLLKGWWWNSSDNNLGINIISSLGSCYCELLGYMRQCFIYCSIFPRNYVFEKYKLVQMWIANGFIQLNNTTGVIRLEDIASECFNELVNRAFLQPSACKTGYIMHDLVRDFASALSSSECHGIFDNKSRDVSQIRYLSTKMDYLSVQPTEFYRQLRTLMLSDDFCEFFGKSRHHLDTILKSSTSLRILDFSSCRWSAAASRFLGHWSQENYEQYLQHWLRIGHQPYPPDAAIREFSPPGAISELKYLRHLDLSFTGINTLPNSICSLCHLQVLDLRGCQFHMLPENMNSLINLRHLHADPGINALIYGIGKLTKLQELHEFCVEAEDGHRITELIDLNNIRGSLCISNLQTVTDPGEAIQANIVGKGYLTALELTWSSFWEETPTPNLAMAILGTLSPTRNLQDLKIVRYPGFALTDWVGQLKHVRVVEISFCRRLQILPPLGQLEQLQKLTLDSLSSIKDINSEFYGTSNVVFRSLEELSFERMINLESWTYVGSRDFMPKLQKLRIVECSKLRVVPFESLSSATKEIFLRWGNTRAISRYLQKLTGPTRLVLQNCWAKTGISEKKNILALPCEKLTCLEYLSIRGFREVCIQGGLWYMTNLKDLHISVHCRITTDLDEQPPRVPTQSARVMHSLTHLRVGTTDLNNIICRTPFLRNLCLEFMGYLGSITEQWLQQLTSLQEMELSKCKILPSSLAAMPSLKKLALRGCYGMHSIPPNGLPGNLKEMQIEGCSIELELRCQNPKEQTMERLLKVKMEESRKMMQIRLRKKRREGSSNVEGPLKSAEEESLADEWLMDEESLLKHQERKLLELGGMDWPNIAHVPYIRVNGKIVQNLYT